MCYLGRPMHDGLSLSEDFCSYNDTHVVNFINDLHILEPELKKQMIIKIIAVKSVTIQLRKESIK